MAIAHQKTGGESASPLDSLAALLTAEMDAVNAAILDRMQSPVSLIPQLASYLIAAGGKRIRPLMTLASTQVFQGDMTRAHGLAAAVEFIHTATLLHDDVVDDSGERRGQASANIVFGNQASVLVGDFLFARAFQLMVADGALDILRILSDAAAVIAQGEVMQLSTTGNLKTTMEDYIDVVKAKTAALFAAACEVGPVIADAPPEQARAMAAYGMNLGIAFQIADDALDYGLRGRRLGKTVGDDFREGKMTAPVILALALADTKEREFWERTLKAKNHNENDLALAQEILTKHQAIDLALATARGYAEAAQRALHSLPPHPFKSILLDLADYSVMRAY